MSCSQLAKRYVLSAVPANPPGALLCRPDAAYEDVQTGNCHEHQATRIINFTGVQALLQEMLTTAVSVR